MASLRSILIADDEPSIRHVLTLTLSRHGYEVRAVGDGEAALMELAARPYDVLISDVRMPRLDGLDLVPKALELAPELTVIMMSAYGGQDLALRAVALGAYDYVQKPFKPEEVVFVLQKADERRRLVQENVRLKASPGMPPLGKLLGNSEPMEELRRQVRKLAPVSTTVLVTGESGTGKELVARALHELSGRAPMPFVAVNCGAIPAGLLESELFGHAKGAFTDARTAKRGLFSEADGGSLFLDEVGELPMSAQVKLLRVLQEGEVRPVGETRTERVDVRVIAATLRDLQKRVAAGEFREDLYYRLNVVNVRVPPLRERQADILSLALEFIHRFNRQLNRQHPVQGLSPEVGSLLTTYRWPGNVRELENAIERAVLLAEGSRLEVRDLPEHMWGNAAEPVAAVPLPERGGDLSLKRATRALEEGYIRAALQRTRGNRTRAAELLELSHRALLYKIKEYGIDPDAEGDVG